MPEYWDVLDENRAIKPYAHRRGDPLAPGDRHLVVEVWVADLDGKILLTLRDSRKNEGGLWECTGGSALRGECSTAAARRELFEETGLMMGDAQPTLLHTTIQEDAFVDTYAIRLDFTLADIRLQVGETVKARLVDMQDLDEPDFAPFLAPSVRARFEVVRPMLRRFLEG